MVRRARAGGIDRQIHRRGGAEGYPGRKLVQTRPPDCRLLKRHASEGDVDSDAGRLGKAGQGGIQGTFFPVRGCRPALTLPPAARYPPRPERPAPRPGRSRGLVVPICSHLPMRVRRSALLLLVASLVGLAGDAAAQTVQLPPPAASSLDRLAQAPVGPPPSGWAPYSPPGAPPFPGMTAGPPPSTWAPSAISGQPGYPGYSPAAPGLAPPPGQPPASLFPAGYPAQGSTLQETYAQTMHVYQGARGSWAYLLGDGSGTRLGVNELDTTATFALPFFHNSPANLNHAPLLITPGFGLQLWDGPETSATMLADLPPSTYDVFLDTAWNPRFTPLFGAELGVRVGIYTNWDVLVWQSWRIMGRAIGTLQLTPTMQGKAGIIYLDRNLVKLLPAIGLTWTPDANQRYDIFFPAPKASIRFANTSRHTWWGYASGEYGGGAWTFRRNTPAYNGISPFDYNDVRICLGAEFVPNGQRGLNGNLEIGYVFARQLFYVDGPPQYQDLPDTMMFRLGLGY